MTKQILQKEEYKQTELGELPKEWEVVRLEEIINYNLGRTPPRNQLKYWEGGTFPWVSIADMKGNKLILSTKEKVTEEAIKKCFSKKISEKGTLLMSFKLTIGRTAILGIDATHNEAIISIYPKNKADKLFLFYYLPSVDYSNYMDRAIKGNTLNKSKINKILIPLPPLPEQQKIASILSTIQDAQEKTDNFINALKELKKSTMKHLFTYGAVPFDEIDRVELKETEIGKIPKEWEVVRFEDCLSDKRVKVSKLQQSQFKKIGKFPIVDQSQDLIAGYWDNEEDLFSSPLPVVIFGDHTRTFKFIDFPFVCGPDGTKILIPEISKVFPKFFYYYLKLLNIPSRGYNRHYSLLKDYLIPLPPLPEQQHIASILSVIDEKIEAVEGKKKALDELFRSMLKDLMTARIRVNNIQINQNI